MSTRHLILTLVAICCCLTAVTAKVIPFHHVKIHKNKPNYYFLGKFCFDYDKSHSHQLVGSVNTTVRISKHASQEWNYGDWPLTVLYFDDEPNSWPSVYNSFSSLSCSEIVAKTVSKAAIDLKWTTGQDGVVYGKELRDLSEGVKPRWWYLVLAPKCNSGAPLMTGIDAMIEFENNISGPWFKQFSKNEQGLNTLYLVFFLIWLVLVLVHLYGVNILKRMDCAHQIIDLFLYVICSKFLNVFFLMMHWSAYTSNGIGIPLFFIVAQFFELCTRVIFMFVLLAMASGYTITTDVLVNRDKIVIGCVFFFIFEMMLFIWGESTVNRPHPVVYIYESAPGVLLILLSFAAFVWFVTTVRDSHKTESSDPVKREFFSTLAFYGAWFLALPVVVALGAMISPHYRQISVFTILLIIQTLILGSMMYLLWPSRAQNYFTLTIRRTDYTIGNFDSEAVPSGEYEQVEDGL